MQEILQKLLKKIDELFQNISNLNNTVEHLESKLEKAEATLAERDAEIALLKERLRTNSINSSCPPSNDGYSKPNPKSFRVSFGKPQGGQKGHSGSSMNIRIDNLSKVEQRLTKTCANYPNRENCLRNAKVKEKRFVTDLKINTVVTEHDLIEMPVCPISKSIEPAVSPENVKAYMQYGESLQAMAVSLSTGGAVSIDRIHRILSGIFNIQISNGAMQSTVQKCSLKLKGVTQKIKDALIHSNVVNFDEIGERTEGKLRWIHTASDQNNTYLIIGKKCGNKDIIECGVLPSFKGIAVHDCWKSYFEFKNCDHALCNAHTLRELQGVIDSHPEQKWAPEFFKLLLDMKKARDEAIKAKISSIDAETLEGFMKKYDLLVRMGRDENPEPVTFRKRGRKKKGKTLALIERLDTYKASVCLFMYNFAVPFTHNRAEQSLRPRKNKVKVSGCFRTMCGAEDYLKFKSFKATATKRGENPFLMPVEVFKNNPDAIFA